MIDLSVYPQRVNGREVRLTPTELRLLRFLVEHPGHAFDQETLLREAWGWEPSAHRTNLVDVCVCRLRQKIEPDPKQPQIVQTAVGFGYYFDEDGEQ